MTSAHGVLLVASSDASAAHCGRATVHVRVQGCIHVARTHLCLEACAKLRRSDVAVNFCTVVITGCVVKKCLDHYAALGAHIGDVRGHLCQPRLLVNAWHSRIAGGSTESVINTGHVQRQRSGRMNMSACMRT